MTFRKRNVGLNVASEANGRHRAAAGPSSYQEKARLPLGTRSSLLDGQVTTSSGAESLDNIFGGHAGIPLGSLILLQERGTTDHAGTLLKYFAAEGILQGHSLHLIGVDESWTRSLPANVASDLTPLTSNSPIFAASNTMKIAWRYRLAERRNARGHETSTSSPDEFC